MNRTIGAYLLVLLSSIAACGDETSITLPVEAILPSGGLIVVSEGVAEPRSVGSYSLRIYAVSNPDFPYDNFVTGIVRPRDGVVERAVLYDIDDDGAVEIIVIVRNVGTGSYLSADAIQYQDASLNLLVSVGGLEKDQDPIPFLRVAYDEAYNK